eukprot:TRINITY_DN11026_c0_g2_i1.p3 TRINITY_DN11026_c0_g2~~TRINITY_DN11026_c0_g2_i1.p3  ORF type:complete len:180 (+),score=30.40 TRINITY_DN11026_c0_g2_i1:1672-2211(+)
MGNDKPIVLLDMSMEDGTMPLTKNGDPAHPAGSHMNRQELDLSYYLLRDDNMPAAPCVFVDAAGNNQARCMSEPGDLDVWRTALFIGYLHESPFVTAVGVDDKMAPYINDAIAIFCSRGFRPIGCVTARFKTRSFIAGTLFPGRMRTKAGLVSLPPSPYACVNSPLGARRGASTRCTAG